MGVLCRRLAEQFLGSDRFKIPLVKLIRLLRNASSSVFQFQANKHFYTQSCVKLKNVILSDENISLKYRVLRCCVRTSIHLYLRTCLHGINEKALTKFETFSIPEAENCSVYPVKSPNQNDVFFIAVNHSPNLARKLSQKVTSRVMRTCNVFERLLLFRTPFDVSFGLKTVVLSQVYFFHVRNSTMTELSLNCLHVGVTSAGKNVYPVCNTWEESASSADDITAENFEGKKLFKIN